MAGSWFHSAGAGAYFEHLQLCNGRRSGKGETRMNRSHLIPVVVLLAAVLLIDSERRLDLTEVELSLPPSRIRFRPMR